MHMKCVEYTGAQTGKTNLKFCWSLEVDGEICSIEHVVFLCIKYIRLYINYLRG